MNFDTFKQSWVGRNLVLLLIVAAFISAIVTYITITGSNEPLGIKPRRMWIMVGVNLSILVLLTGIIGARIY
jgi:nitrogen fixation/metabolism regulation signal transduction histidine kinase